VEGNCLPNTQGVSRIVTAVWETTRIISKLDYVNLGIDAVWLNLCFCWQWIWHQQLSEIMSDFGTMQILILKEMHKRGINYGLSGQSQQWRAWLVQEIQKLQSLSRLLPLVASRKGKAVQEVWRKQWCLEYDPTTDVLSTLFFRKQPDLNWENPNQEMKFMTLCVLATKESMVLEWMLFNLFQRQQLFELPKRNNKQTCRNHKILWRLVYMTIFNEHGRFWANTIWWR
jgi:hypothetical protein